MKNKNKDDFFERRVKKERSNENFLMAIMIGYGCGMSIIALMIVVLIVSIIIKFITKVI